MDLKRPSAKETEEELLRMQLEFLSSKSRPCAQVINKRKSENSENLDKEESKKLKYRNIATSSTQETEDEPSVLFDNHDMEVAEILADIMERDVNAVAVKPPQYNFTPFPKTFVRDKELKNCGGKQKKSLFAMQMEKNKQKSASISTGQITPNISIITEGSFIVDGSGLNNTEDSSNIHRENLVKLASMSEKEILAQQQHLLNQLDPKIVQFLQSKRDVGKSAHFKSEQKGITEACQSKMIIDDENKTFLDTDNKMEMVLEPEHIHQTSNVIDIDEKSLPIKPSESKKWLHMDVVEKDKLAWMNELPLPKPVDLKTAYPARFDLKGNLLSRDDDIPTYHGLHHHGEEQEVAGYSVEELFLMARSSYQSQRIMSLQTLACILQNNWQGLYDECLESSLVQQLLDAGIVPLLRWSLDENSESLFAAAVSAIYNLICSESDEACLDWTRIWKNGHVSPFLKPVELEKPTESEMKEMTDFQIVKLDVIKGFLRMDILPRLRYILEVCHPSETTVSSIFGILIRIARHSLESASKVMECPHLMQIIISEFLPKCMKFVETIQGQQSNVYGFPLRPAIKLIRVLASAGRHIASYLIAKFDVLSSLCCYMTVDPSDVNFPQPEALLLLNESLAAWRIFLMYNLATQEYVDLFPLHLQKLCFYQSLNVNTDAKKNIYHYDSAALFFSIFEAIVSLISGRPKELANESPPFTWHCITDVYNIAETYCKKWLWQMTSGEGYMSTSAEVMLGSCLNFITSYYKHIVLTSHLSIVDILQKMDTFGNEFLLPLLRCPYYRKLTENLCIYSALLSKELPGNQRDAATLPSLGCIMWASDVMMIAKEGTPFPFLTSVVDLISVMQRTSHNMNEVVEEFINNNIVVNYVHQIINTKRLHNEGWLCRYENIFLSSLAILNAKSKCYPIYYNLSLRLLPAIRFGEDHFAEELMRTVIFSPNFIKISNELDENLQLLHLEDKIVITSATGETIEVHNLQLLKKTCQNLASLVSTYVDFCFDKQAVQKSRWRIEQDCNEATSLSTEIFTSSGLEKDWPYAPIKKLYKKSKTKNLHQDISSAEVIQTVINCLQLIHLLEWQRPTIIKYIPTGIRFCNLSTLFLIASDVFLNSDVQKYYYACICELLKHSQNKTWKLETSKWSGVTTFPDLYAELLDQYEAVSYGDHLFGCSLLIPLQQCYSSSWKKLLFMEHAGVLRTLNVPMSEVPISLDKFLNPAEKDEELLSLYARNLVFDQLRENWCPLLYIVATHHLKTYLKKECNFQDQYDLLLKLMKFRQLDENKKQTTKNWLQSVMFSDDHR